MGGGLVFTGMPRRREVLGTGIIRWAKVVNPDGSVTWREAQPTSTANADKEEKGTKAKKKQVLERPSWIDVKKESSNVRVSKRRATDAVELKAKELKVEARPTRAFSFRTEEKEILRTEKITSTDSKVRFDASTRDEKQGVVAGLATKFGSTCTTKAEALPMKKKEVETQQPERPLIERRNAEDLDSDKLKLTRDESKAQLPQKEEKKTVAHDFPSHWSTQSDPKQEESDAELALRLANTEKIFRQQEQKIQAALDRIRDLERQLATGFAETNSTSMSEQNDIQSKTSSSSEVTENDSIAAGGREAGPYFRHTNSTVSATTTKLATTKGPLPFSRDDDDDDESHCYRVLTVNSSKPQLCAVDEVNQHEESAGVISSRTPSPTNDSSMSPQEQQPKSPDPDQIRLHPIVNDAPRSHTYHQLRTSTKSISTPQTHKPLPALPIDAIRPTPSICVRPRPPPRSVSIFKKLQRIRPLTPIPEEPCSLKRRPRVVRTRRMSRSSGCSSLRRVSTSGECGYSGYGECSGGGGGETMRRSFERCWTH